MNTKRSIFMNGWFFYAFIDSNMASTYSFTLASEFLAILRQFGLTQRD